MKRLWIMLLAIAMALVIALPAGAGKPEKPDKPSPEPPTACAPEWVIEGDRGSFGYECDWTPVMPDVVDGSTLGMVTVNVDDGEIGSLSIFVRDSAPGDVCELMNINKTIGDNFTASFPLFYDYADDRDYDLAEIYKADYKDKSYWDVDAHWCAPLDPVEGEWDDSDPALRVNVNYRAKESAKVTISFTAGQADTTP